MPVAAMHMLGEWFSVVQLDAQFQGTSFTVFGSTQDLSDSGLKIIVPLIIAYCQMEKQEPEKRISMSVSDKDLLTIVLKIPVRVNGVSFPREGGFPGILTSGAFPSEDI